MEKITVFAAIPFIIAWVIGVLGSLSISLLIILTLFSAAQIIAGVPNTETIIYNILQMLGAL